MNISQRTEAIRLRRHGVSYQAILSQLHVAKSTLWRWLKREGLVETQPQRLTDLKRLAQQKAAIVNHERRLRKTQELIEQARQTVGFLSERDLFLILEQVCHVDRTQLMFDLYIHESGNVHSARTFWSSALHVPSEQFRIRFKRHNLSPRRKRVGADYVGLIRVSVRRSTALNRTIAGWIQGLCSVSGESANGKPSDFGSEYPGSIPGSPAFALDASERASVVQ